MHDTYIYLINNTHYSEAHEIEKLSKIPILQFWQGAPPRLRILSWLDAPSWLRVPGLDVLENFKFGQYW